MAESSEDPTCIARMLNDFRSSNLLQRKSRLTPLATRLEFDTPKLENSTVKRNRSKDDSNVSYSEGKRLKTGGNDDSFPVPASPWESHCLRAEVLEAKTQIVNLENQISRLHALRNEMEIVFESEKVALLQQQDRDRSKIKDMEKHLREIRRRELEYKEELNQYKKTSETDKFNMEKKIHMLQKQNSSLEDKLKETEMSSHKRRMSSERHTLHLESDLGQAVQELVELRDRADELQERLQEATEKLLLAEQQENKLQQAQLKIKEMEAEEELNKEAIAMAKSQQYKILQYPDLEKELSSLREENKHLKESVTNKLLLEEMVVDLQTRQTDFEEREKELVWLQDNKKHLEEMVEEWCAMAQDHCDTESLTVHPSAVRKRIEYLQQRVLVLTSEVAQLDSKLKASGKTVESLTLTKEKAKKQIDKQQVHADQQANHIRLLQKKLLLISKERDSYRLQLDSYEKELTMTSTNPQFQQQRNRIEVLESTSEGFRDLVERLEAELEKGGGVSGNNCVMEKLQKVEYERDSLLREKEQLLKRRDELEQKLEYSALKLEPNSSQSKVLHFRMNPAAEAEAKRVEEFESLQAECNQLRERVKLLQEGQTVDVTQQVNQLLATNNLQELHDLREQVKSHDLRMKRMVDVFKETSQEYREVCYMLFGYKMDRIQDKVYKLSSMYAEHPDDHLLFKLTSANELNLMETPFSTTFEDLIELHLQQQHSMPMFMGAVTLDLYSRQTMMDSPSAMSIIE